MQSDSPLLDPLKLLELELSQICVNPYQPRKQFKEEELLELAESIKAVGLIHPPVVRFSKDSKTYEIIAGERRFRAAQLAGLKKISVLVSSSCSSSQFSAEAALIENIQRADLNPLEIANALKKLMEDFGFNQQELACRVGKKRSTLANYLRLLSLPKVIQDSLISQLMTMGHAKAILALETKEKQLLLHEIILRDDLSVREAEKMASHLTEKTKKYQLKYVTKDFYIEQLSEKIEQKLGRKAFIHHQGKKGSIRLYYYTLDDLDRLLSQIGLNED